MDPVDRRQVARLALVPLAVPALELAGDVALVAPEVAQPGGVDVDGVDRRHRVDQRAAGVRPARRVERRLGLLAVAQDGAVDEAHRVERRVVDRRVVAEAEDRRHGDRRILEPRDHAVLAAHVVGAGEDVAERWPAEDEALPVGRRDLDVMFEWPPVICSNSNGPTAPSTFDSSHSLTFGDVEAGHVTHQ